jgi:ferritin-like metal-binding protein YciE
MQTTPKTLTDILIEEITELYELESRLMRVLPLMVERATDEGLRTAIAQHHQEAEEHLDCLRRSLEVLEASLRPVAARGVVMTVGESEAWLQGDEGGHAADASLICMALKIAHYKTAGYASVCTFANLLGFEEITNLLQTPLRRNSGMMRHMAPSQFAQTGQEN